MSTDTIGQEPMLPNQPFFSWLRTQTTLFTSQILALLTLVSAVASLTYSLIRLKDSFIGPESIVVMVAYAHLVFLIVFIVSLIQVLDDNDRGSYRVRMVYERVFGSRLTPGQTAAFLKRSKAQLKTFKLYFLLFWCFMFSLYVGFAFKYGVELSASEPGSPIPNLAKDDHLFLSFIPFALNNLSLLFVFWCFVVLYLPSKRGRYVLTNLRANRINAIRLSRSDDSKGTPRKESWSRLSSLLSRLRPRLAISQWAQTLLVNAAVFTLKRHKFLLNRHRLLLVLSTLVIIAFTTSFWLLAPNADQMSEKSIRHYTVIFNSLSGILNAIVLALLIARMDSKLIGLPSWLICILYLYAAVQPLFFAFEVYPEIAAAVLIVVFIFKIYFFLIIMYVLQTGRMLNYFFCFPFLSRRLGHLRTAERPDPTEKPGKSSSKGATSERRRTTGVLSAQVTRLLSIVLGVLGLGWLWFLLPYFAAQVAVGNYGGVFTNSADFKLTFDGLHLLFAVVIILIIYRLRSNQSEDSKTIEKVCQGILNEPSPQPEALEKSGKQLLRFKYYFLLFWVFIFGLYLALGYKHFVERNQPAPNMTERLSGLRQVLGEFWDHGLILTLNNLSFLFLFSCFLVLYLPALDDETERKQKLMFRYSLFFVVMLTLAFFALITLPALQGLTRATVEPYTIVFNGISGTLNAVALALLIARLDSKLFDISSFFIFVLLTYAGLQPLFVIFESQAELFVGLQTLVVVSALLFKLCFSLILMNTWRTGTMRTYLFCFPLINKRIDSIFANQFEFKTARERERFNLSILKKNIVVYSTDTAFDSRSLCDETAQRLRQLMSDKKNYGFREEAGTHWVVVNDENGKKCNSLCESIPLRSKDEAEKLVKESVDKIPYCKYNRS